MHYMALLTDWLTEWKGGGGPLLRKQSEKQTFPYRKGLIRNFGMKDFETFIYQYKYKHFYN